AELRQPVRRRPRAGARGAERRQSGLLRPPLRRQLWRRAAALRAAARVGWRPRARRWWRSQRGRPRRALARPRPRPAAALTRARLSFVSRSRCGLLTAPGALRHRNTIRASDAARSLARSLPALRPLLPRDGRVPAAVAVAAGVGPHL